MPKFSVAVETISTTHYLIEADTVEEAESLALNGPWDADSIEDTIDGDGKVVSSELVEE